MNVRALFLSLTLVAPIAAGQPPALTRRPAPDQAQPGIETKHLTIRTSANTSSAAPGGSVTLFVDVEPKPKMHVYAPDQKDYIPITLTITPDEGFRATPAKYPVAEKYFFAPLKEIQLVYSKPFRIAQPVTLARTGAGAALTIRGTVRYQACDDAICYVPQQVPVTWTLKPVSR
jgi:DsbC/DsbD-like thiol-disulfide interchange protein